MASDSSILYKFRSGTSFEVLPLPGTSATLFDIKRAIVKAKKLDKGNLEFDLSIRNANNEDDVFVDDGMLLPRGSRIIVQRLPAGKGMGLLDRIAKSELGIGGVKNDSRKVGAGNVDHSRFYEIASREEEEFLSTKNIKSEESDDVEVDPISEDEDKNELEKLQNVMDLYKHTNPTISINNTASSSSYRPIKQRYNADPEIRNEEKNVQQKKRATGIPRTFLNLSKEEEKEDGERDSSEQDVVFKLQPNTLGFQELISRSGGKSTSDATKNLDYALQLTNETIPDFLKCGICHNLVKDAMLLPWDTEGRTTCEKCIRTSLNTSGFTCPLTNIDGVSPDDLHPNFGLRKAAETFLKSVWEKVQSIEKEQQLEQKQQKEKQRIEDDVGGVVVQPTREKKKKKEDEFGLGGDDDEFGGDVFAVTAVKQDVDVKDEIVEDKKPLDTVPTIDSTNDKVDTTTPPPAIATTLDANQQTNNQANSKKKQSRGPPPGYTFGVAQNKMNHPPPPIMMLPVPPPPPPIVSKPIPPPPPPPKRPQQATSAPPNQPPPGYVPYQQFNRGGRFNARGSGGYYPGPAYPPYSQHPPPYMHPNPDDGVGQENDTEETPKEHEPSNDKTPPQDNGESNKRQKMEDKRPSSSSSTGSHPRHHDSPHPHDPYYPPNPQHRGPPHPPGNFAPYRGGYRGGPPHYDHGGRFAGRFDQRGPPGGPYYHGPPGRMGRGMPHYDPRAPPYRGGYRGDYRR